MAKKEIPNYIRKQRNDWGAINPVTKVIQNKKKEQKIKHKKRMEEQYCDQRLVVNCNFYLWFLDGIFYLHTSKHKQQKG